MPGSHNGSVVRTCDHCGVRFPTFPSRRGRYCSNTCRYAAARGRPHPDQRRRNTRPCTACGGVIDRPLSRDRYGRDYCSWACYVTATRHPITRPCAACGASLTRSPSFARAERWFCDNACQGRYLARVRSGAGNPSWKGGARRYYGTGWKPLRRASRAAAHGHCARCQAPATEVHHVLPVRYFASVRDAHFPSNVIALCHACHRAAHRALEDVLPLFESGAAAQVVVPGSIRGEKNGGAKLTEAAVLDMRRRYARGTDVVSVLAREYGVSVTCVYQVVRRTRWRHLG